MRSSVCFNVLTCATPYKQRSLQTVARLPSDKAPRTGEGTRQGGMDAGRGRESERQGGLGVAGVWPVMGGGAVGDHRGNVGNEPEKIIAKEMSLRNVWPQRGGRRGGGGGSGREWNHISLRRIFILPRWAFLSLQAPQLVFPGKQQLMETSAAAAAALNKHVAQETLFSQTSSSSSPSQHQLFALTYRSGRAVGQSVSRRVWCFPNVICPRCLLRVSDGGRNYTTTWSLYRPVV